MWFVLVSFVFKPVAHTLNYLGSLRVFVDIVVVVVFLLWSLLVLLLLLLLLWLL